MELTIYDIIQKTIVTEKSTHLFKTKGQLVIQVHPASNKKLIKEAVEKLLNVSVLSVRVMVRKGKVKTFKRRQSIGKTTKRAIISIGADSVKDIMQQFSGQNVNPVESLKPHTAE